MTYSEKLKDPRWQKKRLEILNRDNFTCQKCKSTTNTLNVHHIRYTPGKNPWDYGGFNLITLCNLCHSKEHEPEKIYDYSGKYNHLIIDKPVNEALVLIDEKIKSLQNSLITDPKNDEVILTEIVYLQEKRKGLICG